MSLPATCDIVIIGGGIVGVSIARELRRRNPSSSIVVIEKEPEPAAHASGRNSGVLHAGFYYTADSLKARFCRQGNAALRAYCESRGLALNRCGKLVVARMEADLSTLAELARRAEANNVEVHRIDAREAAGIEPRALTVGAALWSPTTVTVDPAAVVRAMVDDARVDGVEVCFGALYVRRERGGVLTSRGPVSCGHVVNAAGLYADRIAHDFGFGAGLTILPFKGLYLYCRDDAPPLRTNVYPVPDLRNPFLGVHWTVTVDGRPKIGPTAIPCLWREHYGGLSGFRFRELAGIARLELDLLVRAGFDFRGLALSEARKFRRSTLVQLAAELISETRPAHFRGWGRPGIRAQLIDVRRRTLVMDFVVQGDADSTHVLNAVSPAFTCSIPFAAHVVDIMECA